MKHLVKRIVLVMVAAFTGVLSYAQVTTSSLGGRIVDEKGESLPGVAIVATHVPSGTVYGVTTNSDGRYTIQGMRTGGPYKVEVSSLGYQTVNHTDVYLELGELYSLNSTLKEANEQLQEVVVVASPNSKFANVEKTGASTNISGRDMQNMPSVNRSISDVARLSPYGGNGMSFGGGDGRSTNFTVDGADFNNNFGLSSKLPGGGSPISIDAIEEMQIVISPYDVRQTNFIGGGVNAITKSGTNTFKGTAYAYHRNENMHGNRVYNQELSARAIDRNTTYGFTLGGPIVKNKLFFFVNYERSEIPTVANRWRASKDGKANVDQNISRTTIADMEKVSALLKDKYGYDPGSYTDFPANEYNNKFLVRLDWNITQKHHLALRYNYTNNTSWFAPNATSSDTGQRTTYARMSEKSMSFANSMYSMNNLVQSVSFDLNSRLSNNLSNQFLVTYSNIGDIRGTNSSPFPFVDILSGYEVKDGKTYQDLDPYMSFGYELFTWNNAVRNNVINAKDDITLFLGAHKITAGVNYEYQLALNSYMRNGTGYYRYASLDDFLTGAAPIDIAITHGYGGDKNPSAKVRYNKIGAYVQDEWNVNDRVKLTYGLRLDDIMYSNKDLITNNKILSQDYNGRKIDTGKWPKNNIQISPRVGFSWDVLGDRSLKVRGGTGIFAGRLPLVYFTNMPSNTGMVQNLQKFVTKYDGGVAKVSDADRAVLDAFKGGLVTNFDEMLARLRSVAPGNFPENITPEDGGLPSEIQAVDPNFKMPQVWKSSIAVDYTFPVSFPLTISGEFIYNKTINGVTMTDWNLMDNSSWARFNGSDNRHIYSKNSTYGQKTAYVLSNTNRGWGYNANVSITAEPVKGLQLMAAYTHTVQREVSGMPGNNAASVYKSLPSVDGPNFVGLNGSQYVNPDRLIASATWRDKSNQFSIFYEGIRYGGYSYVYANDLNGDNNAYDLLYIPKSQDDLRFVSEKDAQNFWAFLSQDKYLSSHKGQYAKGYDVAAPMVHTIDLRYAHDFTVKIGSTKNTLQLSFDLMNALNLFNSKWGVASRGNSKFTDTYSNIRPLAVDHIDADGVPVFKSNVPAGAKTWEPSISYGNCWYMQIGIKYMFN